MAFLICNTAFKELYGNTGFDEFVEANIGKKSLEDLLFIAATNRLAIHFELQLVEKFFERNNIPATNFFVSNLEGLVRKAFNHFVPKGNNKILSDAYRFLLFYEAFESAELEFFKRKGTQQKQSLYIVKWLSNIIFGLKEDGITPEKLSEELASMNPNITNNPKFKDTFLLFQKYQTLLGKSQLFDIIDATILATKNLLGYFNDRKILNNTPEIFLPFIQEHQTIVLFGFFDFKVPEIEFLTALSNFSNPIGIYLDFDENNGPLFGNFIDLVLTFKNKGFFSTSIPETLANDAEEKPSVFLKKYLFNNYRHNCMPGLRDIVKIIETENRFTETKEIAKLCNYLIQVRGFKPSEICIVTKNPSKYVPIFREVFALEQVPVNITERFKLSTSPLVISILAALDVVARNFLFQDFRKVLQSFYFRFEATDEATGKSYQVGIENFLEATIRMKLIGGFGKDYYLMRFSNRINSLKRRIEHLREIMNPDDTEVQELKSTLKLFIEAERTFKTILNYFNFDNKKYTVKEFRELIEDNIIKRFGVYEVLEQVFGKALNEMKYLNISEKINRLEAIERDSRALTRFLKVLGEFTFIHSQRFGNQKFNLSELVELLKIIVYDEKFQISRKPNYGVTITTIEQTRGIPFKVMILCGAIDGELPNRYNPEQFLGKKLGRTERRHFENERLEFYYFLGNSPSLLDKKEKQIYIFYPRSDAKKEFVRSPFINYLLDIIGLPESDVCYNIRYSLYGSKDDSDLEWRKYITNQELRRFNRDFGKEFSFESIGIPYFELYNSNRLNSKELTNGAIDFIRNLVNQPISVTFLEDYRKCPFRFFANRILRIWQPISEIEVFLNNLERGQILHSIVSNFFKSMAQQQLEQGVTDITLSIGGMNFAPVFLDIAKKKQYELQIEEITSQVLNNFESVSNFFEIDKEKFIATTGEKSGYVKQWLNYELLRRNLSYLPTIFELGFGFQHKNSLPSIPVFSKEGEELFHFRGKIDRIDICERTDERTGKKIIEVLIIDYKLTESECKNSLMVSKGNSFQMPFYAYAIRYIFQNYVSNDLSSINLVYQVFDFKKKSYGSNRNFFWNNKIFYIDSNSVLLQEIENIIEGTNRKKELKQDGNDGLSSLNNLIDISIVNAQRTIHSITRNINFPVAPQGRVCNYCEYSTICKIRRY